MSAFIIPYMHCLVGLARQGRRPASHIICGHPAANKHRHLKPRRYAIYMYMYIIPHPISGVVIATVCVNELVVRPSYNLVGRGPAGMCFLHTHTIQYVDHSLKG